MARVEVDEAEYEARGRVAQTIQQMMANPAARRKILEAQKIVAPDQVIPEIDAAEPLREEIKGVRDSFNDLRAEMAKDREARAEAERTASLRMQWQSGRSKLLQNGYTDEGIAAVEKFMEDKGVADHEVAAAAYERLYPAQEPVRAVGGNRFDLFDPGDRSSDQMKALLANPEDNMALNSIVTDTLRQVRGR